MILGTAALAGCGGAETNATQADTSAIASPGAGASKDGAAAQGSESAGQIFSGDGDITEISENKVTISHGPIEGIGWPAMTMGFSVGSPEVLRGLNVGDPVAFRFQKAGADYVITSINKAQ